MNANSTNAQPVMTRVKNGAGGAVTAEIGRRLEERLGEVKGAGAQVWRVGAEVLDAGYAFDIPQENSAVLANVVLTGAPDVAAAVYQMVKSLRPDGVLLATFLGAESFTEIRQAFGPEHAGNLPDVQDVGGLLQRLKLALPVIDRDRITLTFRDFAGMYATLREEGWSGNALGWRRQGLVTPRKLAEMETRYRAMFGRGDGRLPLTVEVIYAQAFRPHDNQPVSAKRGSGKVSLVRILGEES